MKKLLLLIGVVGLLTSCTSQFSVEVVNEKACSDYTVKVQTEENSVVDRENKTIQAQNQLTEKDNAENDRNTPLLKLKERPYVSYEFNNHSCEIKIDNTEGL